MAGLSVRWRACRPSYARSDANDSRHKTGGQGSQHSAAQCSRCLRPVHREVVTAVRELFETEPIEGQTYPLEGEEIDLELPVRDALLSNANEPSPSRKKLCVPESLAQLTPPAT